MKKKLLCGNVTTLAQAPIYNELLKEETTSVTGSKCYRRVSDIYLLLNQNRIDRQTKEALIDNIQSAVGSSGLSELRNKYSDSELCNFVKSRYIQSKSELQDYMRYLMFTERKQRIDNDFNDKISKATEKKDKEEEVKLKD